MILHRLSKHVGRAALALLLVGIAAVGLVTTTGGAVFAHASLVSTSPAANSVVATSPGEIVLMFTEPVDVASDAVRLIDASGAPVALGQIGQSRGDQSIVAVPSGPLPTGSYVVSWSAVSADSHPISGAFMFSVGQPSAGAEAIDPGSLQTTSRDGPTRWVTVGRFASYTGIALLIGTCVMVPVLAPGALKRRRVTNLATIGGLLGLAGTTLMIAAQASMIGTSFTDWPAVAATRSGTWWLARLALIAIITIAVPWRHVLGRHAPVAPWLIIAAGLFAVTGSGGHGVAGRAIPLGYLSTVVHLAAMTAWIGGLAVVGVVLRDDEAWAAARRFSPIALWSVVALAVTGLANGWRQLARLSALTDTSYGRWLLVKVVFVGAVVVAAAFSRRAVRASAASVADAARADRAVRAELIGIGLVMVATAGLTGATPPPIAAAPAITPVAANRSVSVTNKDKLAEIELAPAVTGGTTIHVYVSSLGGSLQAASEITVRAELSSEKLGPLDFEVLPAGPNHVVANDADLPLPGLWTITVRARYGEFDEYVFTADFDVRRG